MLRERRIKDVDQEDVSSLYCAAGGRGRLAEAREELTLLREQEPGEGESLP